MFLPIHIVPNRPQNLGFHELNFRQYTSSTSAAATAAAERMRFGLSFLRPPRERFLELQYGRGRRRRMNF